MPPVRFAAIQEEPTTLGLIRQGWERRMGQERQAERRADWVMVLKPLISRAIRGFGNGFVNRRLWVRIPPSALRGDFSDGYFQFMVGPSEFFSPRNATATPP